MFGKFILLFIVWIGLTNSLHYQELIVGIIVSIVIVYFFTKSKEKINLFDEINKYIRFTPLFIKNLIKSNLAIAKIVLDPKLPINPGIIKLRTTLSNDFDKLLLANAITLTPGTITMDLEDNDIYIHVLDLQTKDKEILQQEILEEYETILNDIHQNKTKESTMQYPIFTQEHKSLMAKYLTNDIFDKLKDKKTINNFTIDNAINSGFKNPDSGIGAYAGDIESYETFDLLFDPIIEEYHNFSTSDKHQSDLNPDNLNAPNSDDLDKYIISTRIRVGRNLAEFPLGPAISDKQRDEVETIVSEALSLLDGNLSGKYYPINGMSEKDSTSLIEDHFLFKAGDRFLETAGLNRNWPMGRGIYHNIDKTFLVWINEEDQLRIISMQKGGDIKEVFTRLTTAISKLEEKMKFSFSEHLGYITSCPTNLGTAMRASVHIKVPNLSNDMERFKTITDKHHLQIRGINGEHSQSKGGVYDISNKRRLGVTEVQCVQDMYDGVIELIEAEKELS